MNEYLQSLKGMLKDNGHGGSIASDVRKFVETTDGEFSLQDTYNFLQVLTKEGKSAIHAEIHRLVKSRTLERAGRRNGVYRRIESEYEYIDFLNAPTEEFDIALPLGLSELVCTYPKNIIVVAGAQNAGKTCFMLNVVRMNMNRHKVWYWSSEMGASELRMRLEKFGIPLTDWRFKPAERSSCFSDIIQADDINVIDYLEVEDNFFLVGKELKAIYEKLDTGIALVALQKDKHKEYGRGATFGLEKPRLYVTLDHSIAKIAKAKNWRGVNNPNGKICNVRIVNGSDLSGDEWHRQSDEEDAGVTKRRVFGSVT